MQMLVSADATYSPHARCAKPARSYSASASPWRIPVSSTTARRAERARFGDERLRGSPCRRRARAPRHHEHALDLRAIIVEPPDRAAPEQRLRARHEKSAAPRRHLRRIDPKVRRALLRIARRQLRVEPRDQLLRLERKNVRALTFTRSASAIRAESCARTPRRRHTRRVIEPASHTTASSASPCARHAGSRPRPSSPSTASASRPNSCAHDAPTSSPQHALVAGNHSSHTTNPAASPCAASHSSNAATPRTHTLHVGDANASTRHSPCPPRIRPSNHSIPSIGVASTDDEKQEPRSTRHAPHHARIRGTMPQNFALTGVAGYIAPRHLKAIKDTGNRLVAAASIRTTPSACFDRYFPDDAFFTEFERFDRLIESCGAAGDPSASHYVGSARPTTCTTRTFASACASTPTRSARSRSSSTRGTSTRSRRSSRETGRKVYTVLQLRLLPAIVASARASTRSRARATRSS